MTNFEDKTPEQILNEINDLINNKKHDEAEKLLNQYLTIYPEDVSTKMLQGKIAFYKYDFEKALLKFRLASVGEWDNPIPIIWLARINYLIFKFKEALGGIEMVLINENLELGSEIECRSLKAQILFAMGKYVDAEKELKWLLTINPNHPIAIIVQTRIKRIKGNFRDSLLEPFIKLKSQLDDSALSMFYYLICKDYLRVGVIDSGKYALEQSVKLDNEFAMIYYKCYLDKNKEIFEYDDGLVLKELRKG